MLSLLYHVYKFTGKEFKARVEAWSSVKLELRVLRGLLVFAQSDLRVRPNQVVTITDACLSGYGVGESIWDVRDVVRVAGRDERWRFKDRLDDSDTHRSLALAEYSLQAEAFKRADVYSDFRTVKSFESDDTRALEEDFKFPNIEALCCALGLV